MADGKGTSGFFAGLKAGLVGSRGREPSADDLAALEGLTGEDGVSSASPAPKRTRRGVTPPPVALPSDGALGTTDPLAALSADIPTILANHKVPNDPTAGQALTFFGTVSALDPATKKNVMIGFLQSLRADPAAIGQILTAQAQALVDEITTQERGAMGRQRSRDERFAGLKQAAEAQIAEYTRKIEELRTGIAAEENSVRTAKAQEDGAVAAFKARIQEASRGLVALIEFLRTITPSK